MTSLAEFKCEVSLRVPSQGVGVRCGCELADARCLRGIARSFGLSRKMARADPPLHRQGVGVEAAFRGCREGGGRESRQSVSLEREFGGDLCFLLCTYLFSGSDLPK